MLAAATSALQSTSQPITVASRKGPAVKRKACATQDANKQAPPATSRLMVLKDEWEALLVRCAELDARRKPFDDKAYALAPMRPLPEPILYRVGDDALRLTCGIPKPIGNGDPIFYTGPLVERLRLTMQATEEAQARAIEIVAAWDAHSAFMKGVDAALGIPALDAEEEALNAKHMQLRLEIRNEIATTLEEIRFKCSLVLYCHTDSLEDLCQDILTSDDADSEALSLSVIRDLLKMEGAR